LYDLKELIDTFLGLLIEISRKRTRRYIKDCDCVAIKKVNKRTSKISAVEEVERSKVREN